MARDRTGEFSWRVFFRSVARALGIRGGRAREPEVPLSEIDPWTAASSGEAPIGSLLAEIEQDALAIYAEHGLPTRRGHYARAPGDREWQFVAERMEVQDRWALVEEYPPEQGWKFATLADLGLHAAEPQALRMAGRLLSGTMALRGSARGGNAINPSETLDAAVRLGAEWQELRMETAWREAEPVTVAKPKGLPRARKTP